MYVIITGASRGIGLELAKIYASHKYDLILTCKNNIDKLNQLKNELENEFKIKAHIKQGNLDENFLNNIDDIYMLINNAGIADYRMLIDTDLDKYYELIDSNITTNFINTKTVLPTMIKQKQGIIVNISSVWGLYGSSMESVYSLTKGAINSFTKAIAKEYVESNIDCIAFALGMVDTDMNKKFTKEELDGIVNKLDNKKMFTATEVANYIYDTVLNHKYTTGDIIEYNNGLI